VEELLQARVVGAKEGMLSIPTFSFALALYDSRRQQLIAKNQLLESTVQYSQKFTKTEHFLSENHGLCQCVVDAALKFYEVDHSELDDHIKKAEKDRKVAEKVSVSQALKHLVRDWSEEGLSERGDAFPCLLQTIDGLFPDRFDGGEEVKVLLPGAGLGRLGHDVSALKGKWLPSN
jgi:carnosine N-methyltransferase